MTQDTSTPPETPATSPATSPEPVSLAQSSPTTPVIVSFPTTTPSGPITRCQLGKVFPKQYNDDTILYNPNRRAFFNTPTSHKRALSDPAWYEAMKTEYDALHANKTWVLVPRPSGVNIVGCKWIFKVKQNHDGSIDNQKERLVACGFT